MRIDKCLANSGVGTRQEVKKILKAGLVSIGDTVVKDGKTQVDPNKVTISVNGEQINYKEFVYFMMNKPQGYISATEDRYLKTVLELVRPEDSHYDLFPAGRLDRDTEGFLLLTNDGQFAHQILSPKKHVPKTYFARIEGVVTEDDVVSFKNGVVIGDGYTTKPAELVILDSGAFSEIELTITEGKFHQVKQMFEAVGKKVVYLKRIAMGALELDESLELGDYRELTVGELELIRGR